MTRGQRLRPTIVACSHNACMSMLALTPPGLLPPAAAAQLEGVFAAASEDDDRYVMSAGVEGLRRLNLPSAEEMASDPSAMSKASLLKLGNHR
jgi:hypothetical protein